MLYEYVKVLKVGELPEGENPYDVNRIDADELITFTNDFGEEETLTNKEFYLKKGYVEATEEEWITSSTGLFYEYVKIKKVGDSPEGEATYDVKRIVAATEKELMEEFADYMAQGYEASTEEEWVLNSKVKEVSTDAPTTVTE